MIKGLDLAWRVSATGVAFGFIFFGGGLLATTILPILSWLPGHRRDRVQWIIHKSFRFYIFMLQYLGLLQLDIADATQLGRVEGKLVVANHPSLLDVVLLMAMIPKTQCIVKSGLWHHRLLGPLVRRAGYIRNDLTPDALIAACRASLDSGDNLIIFPEGTRSQPGQQPRFLRGFANLAILTGAAIQPVIITCEPATLVKGEPWWRIPPHPPLFRMIAGSCLPHDDAEQNLSRGLAARRLVRTLENYYSANLING